MVSNDDNNIQRLFEIFFLSLLIYHENRVHNYQGNGV